AVGWPGGHGRGGEGGARGEHQGRDRIGWRALGRAWHRSREEPLHVLGLWPRGPRGDAARPLGVRSRWRDDPGEDLPGRRYLRGDPDRAHQARPRGGHVDLAIYQLEGLVPSRIQRPSDTATLARGIGDAHELGEAVVVWGGGTRMGVGNAPA